MRGARRRPSVACMIEQRTPTTSRELVEESLARIERLATMCGSRWIGAAAAAAAFGLAHVPYWGVRFSLAADLPFGIVMTIFYLWRRDLVANAIAHSTGLVVSLLSLRGAAA